MKRFTICCLVLFGGLVFASLAIADPAYFPIDSTSNGGICLRWCGYLLPPPYVFETDSAYSNIYIRVGHDPEFGRLGIIRLPLAPPDPLPPTSSPMTKRAHVPMIPADQSVMKQRQMVDSIARAAFHASFQRNGLHGPAMTAAKLVYETSTDLVDSVRVSKGSITRYWKNGGGIPYVTTLLPHRFFATLATPREAVCKQVQEQIDLLNENQVLVVGPGGMIQHNTRITPRAFTAGLDSVQHGQRALLMFDKSCRDEHKYPKPPADIVRLSREGR